MVCGSKLFFENLCEDYKYLIQFVDEPNFTTPKKKRETGMNEQAAAII